MLLEHILSRNGVQGVSKFVGNASIDHVEKLVLCLLLDKHDTVGNVDVQNYCFTFELATLDLDISFWALISVWLFLASINYWKDIVLDLVVVSGEKVAKTIFIVCTNSFIAIWMTILVHFNQLKLKFKLFKDMEVEKLVLSLLHIGWLPIFRFEKP